MAQSDLARLLEPLSVSDQDLDALADPLGAAGAGLRGPALSLLVTSRKKEDRPGNYSNGDTSRDSGAPIWMRLGCSDSLLVSSKERSKSALNMASTSDAAASSK